MKASWLSTDPLLRQIGQTPVIQFPGKDGVRCKMETHNPTGSMKDRIALPMIRDAEESRGLSGDGPIVESSSGNTAQSVALAANRLGYECVITCPQSTSLEKLDRIKAYGAELVLCDPDVPSSHEDHYTSVAEQIADERDGVWLDQYHNQVNPRAHYEWTGEEIVRELTPDVDVFVGVMGTGGTMSGIGRAIQESDYDVQVIGVDAKQSNISREHKGLDSTVYDTDVEGLGKGSKLPTMWFEYINSVLSVGDDEVFEETRRLWNEYGFVIGPSAAAACLVAQEFAQERSGEVWTLVCDDGSQYFNQMFRGDVDD